MECVIENCVRPVKVRGMCAQCYSSASKCVSRKEVTWEELEMMGLALPIAPKGRRASSPFGIMFQKKISERLNGKR